MLEQLIVEHPLSFLYISRENCGVCHVLLPQLQQMMSEFPQIMIGYISADEVEEIAGRLSIFTVPAMILFVDGKEYIREARFVHMQELRRKIDKVYQAFI